MRIPVRGMSPYRSAGRRSRKERSLLQEGKIRRVHQNSRTFPPKLSHHQRNYHLLHHHHHQSQMIHQSYHHPSQSVHPIHQQSPAEIGFEEELETKRVATETNLLHDLHLLQEDESQPPNDGLGYQKHHQLSTLASTITLSPSPNRNLPIPLPHNVPPAQNELQPPSTMSTAPSEPSTSEIDPSRSSLEPGKKP